ncbi:hypothetical protein ACT3CE_13510 [Marinifilum sp. RC60d5]|uniref:hypothetical protein n=1 Tax=Marinifilum sp. RC60d5 TaxID=3458414 RepID=UPI00403566B3
MILELRATVDTNGRMEYQLSNYFANPEDLKALAPHLPEGSCLILLEDGSLSVEEIEEGGVGFSEGFSEPNYSMCGDPTQSIGSENTQNNTFDWGGATGVGMTGAGILGDRIHNVMLDRGKYLPRTCKTLLGKPYGIRKTGEIVLRSRIANLAINAKYLNYARVGGKALGVVGAAASIVPAGYDVITSPSAGNVTSLAVKTIAVGVAFIPVVGWGVALGIGVADAVWGDQLYNWIDE